MEIKKNELKSLLRKTEHILISQKDKLQKIEPNFCKYQELLSFREFSEKNFVIFNLITNIKMTSKIALQSFYLFLTTFISLYKNISKIFV